MSTIRGERPTECDRCRPYFSFAIQAEARQIAVREGVSSAQAFVDEKLEPFHSEHVGADTRGENQ